MSDAVEPTTGGDQPTPDNGRSIAGQDPIEEVTDLEHADWQPSGFATTGRRAWWLIGISIVVVASYVALAALSSLVIPLVIATVLGILFVPLVDRLGKSMPRKLAVAVVMVGLFVVALGSLAVAIAGVVDQGPKISQEISAGIDRVSQWLAEQGVDLSASEDLADGVNEVFSSMLSGASSYFSSAFSGAAAFLAGIFVSVFILFYILSSWNTYARWLGSHMGVPTELGEEILQDGIWSIRRYFSALTVTSFVSAVVIGTTVGLMGVPLAFAIGLVTFITSYVPYLGALISGAFAVLIALGSGGVAQAAIVLVVILAVQNVVQPVLQNKMTAQQLNIDPVVSFGSTIVGAAIAGVLGATLSAPVLSMLVQMRESVHDYTKRHIVPESLAGEGSLAEEDAESG